MEDHAVEPPVGAVLHQHVNRIRVAGGFDGKLLDATCREMGDDGPRQRGNGPVQRGPRRDQGADQIDATTDELEKLTAHPLIDRSRCDAMGHELGPGADTSLRCRQLHDPCVVVDRSRHVTILPSGCDTRRRSAPVRPPRFDAVVGYVGEPQKRNGWAASRETSETEWGQQIRGRGSPTSMSRIRVPPKAVLATTSCG